MEPFTRREFLGGLAVAGAGALLPQSTAGQVRPGRINVHHHLTPPAYVKFLTDNKVREFPNRSVAEGLEDLDKAGIAMAFTSIIGPGIWFGNISDTRRLARECNDWAAKLIADYPGRFGMFASLPLPDIDGSLREIEYVFETLKADGVFLFTNFGQTPLYGDKYLGDPLLAPLYEELNRRRAIIYTHPKDSFCCRDVSLGRRQSNRRVRHGYDSSDCQSHHQRHRREIPGSPIHLFAWRRDCALSDLADCGKPSAVPPRGRCHLTGRAGASRECECSKGSHRGVAEVLLRHGQRGKSGGARRPATIGAIQSNPLWNRFPVWLERPGAHQCPGGFRCVQRQGASGDLQRQPHEVVASSAPARRLKSRRASCAYRLERKSSAELHLPRNGVRGVRDNPEIGISESARLDSRTTAYS